MLWTLFKMGMLSSCGNLFLAYFNMVGILMYKLAES